MVPLNKLLKTATLIPICVGVIIGALLFTVGYFEDAPGMCLLGLSATFVLSMWGLSNAGAIKKGFLAPILLLCFGAGGILLSIVLLLDGEFEELPGLAFVGVALGAILIIIGTIRLRKVKGKKSV